MAHYSAYSGRIFQILLIQGLGSIFNLYAYMKTKNVFVSYIVHLMIDFSGFIVSAIQAGVHNMKGKMIYININGRSSVYYE